MIVQSPAIVLRIVDYQETSRIATVLSWEHGKIAVLARGVKRPKSALAGLLEPGSILDTVYYYKSSRSVQTIKEASCRHKTHGIRRDVEKMAVSMATLEMLGQMLHDHEVNQPMFEFAEQLLVWLDRTGEPVQNLFPYIQLRLADLMGIGLQVETADGGRAPGWLNVLTGSVAAEPAGEHRYRLQPAQARLLQLATQGQSARILQLSLPGRQRQELIRYLDAYLKYHIDGLRDRSSDAIF